MHEPAVRNDAGACGRRRTRDLYRLVEHVSDYVAAVDARGRFSYVSPSAERDFGYSSAELLGRSCLDLVHPADVESVAAGRGIAAASARGVWPRDVRIRTRDGRYRLVEMAARNLLDDPAISAIVIDGRDVTERRRAEARFRAAFESSAIGMALVADDGVVTEANAAFAEMLGYGVEELRGRSHADLTDPDDAEEEERLAAELRSGARETYRLEKRYVGDGPIVWARVTGSRIPDAGDRQLTLVLVEDITAQRHAQQAQAVAELRFRALVETMPAVTYIWESTANAGQVPVTYTSPQVEQLLGYSAEEWEQDPMLWLARVHPDDRDAVLAATAASERDGTPFEMEYRYLAKDGRVVWVRDAAVLIDRTPDGRPWRFQGVMMDVTDRKETDEVLRQSETEVRRSLDVLRRTDEERRELLRRVIAADAAERGRLAEGIEDRSLQDFTAVGLRLETLRRGLDDPEQLGVVDRLGESVRQALARLRHLLVELRPRELDTAGLAAALEQFALAVAPSGVRVSVRNRLAHEPDPEARALAYRIVQDVVAHVLDRSRSAVVVDVDNDAGGTLVRVAGDGTAPEPSGSEEAAIASMRERAEIAGGWLRVGRDAAGAMTLEVWLPGRLAGAP